MPRSVQANYLVEQAQLALIDMSRVTPLTAEDYLLDCDIKNHTKVNFDSKYLLELEQCRVLPLHGDLITKDGELLADFTPQNRGPEYHKTLTRRTFPKQATLSGNSLNLAIPFASNYYHWLLEALPIIRYARELGIEINNYLVAEKNAFVVDSLALLGITEAQVVALSDHELLCENLLTATVQSRRLPPPNSVAWLQSQFLAARPGGARNRRLYLSRGDSSWRGVANEAEVSAFLEQYGFDTVQLGSLSFQEQVILFSEASHIISAHGAGLSNLAFSAPQTKVLEIFPPRWTPFCFLGMSQQSDCDYYFCNAEPLGLSKSEIEHNRQYVPLNADAQAQRITIPLDKLSLFCAEHI